MYRLTGSLGAGFVGFRVLALGFRGVQDLGVGVGTPVFVRASRKVMPRLRRFTRAVVFNELIKVYLLVVFLGLLSPAA